MGKPADEGVPDRLPPGDHIGAAVAIGDVPSVSVSLGAATPTAAQLGRCSPCLGRAKGLAARARPCLDSRRRTLLGSASKRAKAVRCR